MRGEAQPQGSPCLLSDAELELWLAGSNLSPACSVGVRQPGACICTSSASSCIVISAGLQAAL